MNKTILAGLALLALTAARADEGPPPESTKHANLAGYRHYPQQDGESLYTHVCAACHMPSATGGSGALTVPALAKNDKLSVSTYPVMMVMNGHGGMPSFRDSMNDAQIAAVVGYVRTHFGNSYSEPVPVDEVKQVREVK